jgi:crotonobetainyl-CoA:carnitine CoA-transferase CaiB-like acyl-CoA transferase
MTRFESTNRQPTALQGIKIVDLSRVLAGPFCTQILGDHGAEVIKVEPPVGDETRGWGPPFKDGQSSYFLGINRNKQGIALDLSKPEGREIVFKLLEDADVLVENFKTGTLERWGMGYDEVLKKRFPKLVHCRVTGFGADGPFGGLVCYDALAQAMGGIMAVNGERDGEPLRVGIPVADLVTGLYSVQAILLALVERSRSGVGQTVEVALLDAAVSLVHPMAMNWFLDGKQPRRLGNAHSNVTPYDSFRLGEKRIFIGATKNTQFVKMCEILGKPEMATDPRFVDNAARVENRDALRAALEAALAGRDGLTLTRDLMAAGVPAAMVLEVPEVLQHPQVLHRNMIVEKGDFKCTGIPIKLGRTPGSIRKVPPRLGEDNVSVLSAAGFSDAQIAAWRAKGIVVDEKK